jgi:hypothetical protein
VCDCENGREVQARRHQYHKKIAMANMMKELDFKNSFSFFEKLINIILAC